MEINEDNLNIALNNINKLKNEAEKQIKQKQEEIVELNYNIQDFQRKMHFIKRIFDFNIKEDSQNKCIELLKKHL